MTLGLRSLCASGWSLARREASLIGRVGGALVFLPLFAVQLLVEPPPGLPTTRDALETQVWLEAVGVWTQANGGWHLLARAVALVGLSTLAALFVAPERPDVHGALTLAFRLFFRLALATILVAIPVGLGLWLLILPGLYLQARLVAVLPVLLGDRPVAALTSLARSFRITRASQLGLFGAVTIAFVAQILVTAPLAAADVWLRTPSHDNPAVAALVAALLAACMAAYQIALVLLGVVVFRHSDGG